MAEQHVGDVILQGRFVDYRTDTDTGDERGGTSTWSESDLKAALQCLKSGTYGLNECSRKYGISKTTLRRHLLNKNKFAKKKGKDLEAIKKASECGVIMLRLPPHTTHRMQPLDVSIFIPLQTHYEQEAEKWLRLNAGRGLTTFQVSQLLGNAFPKIASMANAISGFRSAGTWPLDCNVFGDHEFATLRPSIDTETASPPAQLGTTSPPAQLGTTSPPAQLGTAAQPAQGTKSPPAQLGTTSPPAQLGTTSQPAQLGTTSPPAQLGTTSPPAQLETASPPAKLGTTSPPAQLGTASLNELLISFESSGKKSKLHHMVAVFFVAL